MNLSKNLPNCIGNHRLMMIVKMQKCALQNSPTAVNEVGMLKSEACHITAKPLTVDISEGKKNVMSFLLT